MSENKSKKSCKKFIIIGTVVLGAVLLGIVIKQKWKICFIISAIPGLAAE